MRRTLAALAFAAFAAPATALSAPPEPGEATLAPHSVDYRPNPAFVPLPRGTFDTAPGAVAQIGEVVVLEGDSDLVTGDGMGNYGIYYDKGFANPPVITNRVLGSYPDRFDEIIILTTFDDVGAQGALAYEISTQQDIRGIGQDVFDETGQWGSSTKKLHAFVNMMKWDQFRQIDGLDPTDPRSSFYTTLGQEFAHRWLSFIHFRDPRTGQASDAMLGRDKAHWASTLQADASVMDGNRWVDNGDGTFSDVETFDRYSPLDLYAMGLAGADEVPPWYLIDGAVNARSGSKIDPANYLPLGTRAEGQRVDIKMDDVVAVEGPRVPARDQAEHDFRVAFVLVTRPGEHAFDDSVIAAARAIEGMRQTWEHAFLQYTGGRGSMCTQVSAPCGSPTAKLATGRIVEAGGNRNGVVEPGEPVSVEFTVDNDGPQAANGIAVAPAAPPKGSAPVLDGLPASPTTIATLAPGQSVVVAFPGTVPKATPCGQPLIVTATSITDGNTFRGFAETVPGLATLVDDSFETDAGLFGANLAGTDTTSANGWQYGVVEGYGGHHGWQFQPQGGHSGDKAWFTGLESGHRGQTDSSLGAGTSTLWSPTYDLEATYQAHLSFWAWYQAIDFSRFQGGMAVDGTGIVVEAQVDGGAWRCLAEPLGDGSCGPLVAGTEQGWRQYDVDLAHALPGAKTMRVRFTVENTDPKFVVEAGLDDVKLTSLTSACNPNAPVSSTQPPVTVKAAGGCRVAGREVRGTLFAIGFALLLVAAPLRRRRR